MPVEITINWNFLGDGEEAHVSYGTLHADALDAEDSEHESEELPFGDTVVPLGSSVLAPGLSMPVPAH
jgi:hypothetical protein